MKIYIVRHGETALNARSIMQGQIDEPLNQNGRDLAAVTGRNMAGMHFDACISSSLGRARETAELILRESGNEIPILLDHRLLEISCGDMEAKSLSEMGEEGHKFLTDPFHFAGFPNGETIRDLCDRTQAFLKELIARDDGKNYLISTHGCAMRAMIHYLKDEPASYWGDHAPYNCSFTILEADGGVARITDIDKVYYDPGLIVDYYSIS